MKSASRVLYIVGRVFNVVTMIFALVGIILGAIFIALKDQIAEACADLEYFNTAKEIEVIGIVFLVSSIIGLLVYVVIFILATNASKKLKEGSTEVAPHVLMLIVGLFGDIFYLLGGIFGIVAANDAERK